jgi:hypothetical protein
VARVNVDGVEGSSIPGGVHLARYGGGDDYVQVEPLLSAWCDPEPAPTSDAAAAGGGVSVVVAAAAAVASNSTSTAAWAAACEQLPQVTPASLELLHGFSGAALLPSGAAPAAGSIAVERARHLLVSRMPPPEGAGCGPPHASLMLHGWLFHAYHAR